MPPRLWRERIEDILDAIAAIRSHTAGLSEADFYASRLVTDAVERNFAVIGEAVAQIPAELRDRYPHIQWRQMRDMRNVVSHVYFAVKMQRVWETIQNDLAPTESSLRELLEHEPDDSALA